MSIEIKNVTKIFGTQTAVNDISFNTQKGEIVGFLGPNGAGKSTTMKMITGFLAPTKGEITVCGIDAVADSLDARRRIGYLPESNPLYYDMYVKEYLHFCAGIYDLGKNSNARVEEMIAVTGLTIESKKKIGALSKGYKQRVGIAQAMLHNPDVLILDEPTSGLDPNQLVEIRNLITELGKEKTVLLSTHIMQEVEAMCSRAIIINRGNIVADSPLALIGNTIKKENSTITLQTKEALQKEWFNNIGVSNIEVVNDFTFQIKGENIDSLKKSILNICLQQNLNVVSLHTAQNNLEEIFRSLTQTPTTV
jgi:ABC-2 type transport system ATP-binding protein